MSNEMSKTIVAQNQELRKTAMAMVIHGQVSKNGKGDQCFISTDDGLYVANSAACTCGSQDCPHTLAADIYNRARQKVETFLKPRRITPNQLFWILRDEVTDPALAEQTSVLLTICQHLHREERSREPNTFYSVCGSDVMFCPTPPRRRGRRYP